MATAVVKPAPSKAVAGDLLKQAIAQIQKKLGNKNELIVYDPKRPVESCSTGSIVVDDITGTNGMLVKRRIVEIFGPESCLHPETQIKVRIDGVEKTITLEELKMEYTGS